MGIVLYGKPVSEALCGKITERALLLKNNGVEPLIKIIRAGNRADDISYEQSIIKSCSRAGIKAIQHTLDGDVKQTVLLDEIKKSNDDASIHGIMVMRPLPSHISEKAVAEAIAPDKDVDCISDRNISSVFTGGARIFPCTAQAVVTLLKSCGYELEGKNIVVAGRSLVVGKPLAMLLLGENATVTVCHSKTRQMHMLTKSADIVITAIGKPKFFGREFFTENSVVVDVGVNYDADTGKMCGDTDFEAIKDYVAAVTPPVGGIGAVTTMTLLENTVSACEIQTGSKTPK